MSKIALAALAGATFAFAGAAYAQQQPDWDKIQIKTTDLGNKTYMLEGHGGVAESQRGRQHNRGRKTPLEHTCPPVTGGAVPAL